jgi:hypothetical protein
MNELNALPMLDALPVLRARFTVRTESGTWPRFKGFLLHGALGAVLARLAPAAFAALMGEGEEPGRLYVLMPPLDEATRFVDGSLLRMEMTFLGPATTHLLPVTLALLQMGSEGIGKGAARFKLVSGEVVSPAGEAVFYSETSGFGHFDLCSAGTIFRSAEGPVPEEIALHFESPLRLKADNRLVRQAPDFALLWQRLAGRLSLLANACQAPPMPSAFKREMTELAHKVVCEGHRLAWVEWSRHSSRQGAEMLFGGLVGEMRFRGPLAPFVPWFALADYVHLGGKTTFGLGATRLRLP